MSPNSTVQAGQKAPVQATVDLVIPVLNEAHVLEKSVTTVRDFMTREFPWVWRVIIVDNGSTDGTDRVARQLEQAHPEIRFVQLPQRGRGRALRHAWTQSDADVMCYTDVDLSTELAALPKLVGALLDGDYDLGTGSRLLPESQTTRSFKREFISRMYNLMVKAVLWTSFSDAQCGFKVVSRRVVQEIVPEIEDQSWFFDTELLVLAEILGVGGGLLVDSWLHTSPIFTLVGMVLGIGAAMYTIWDVAKQSMRR